MLDGSFVGYGAWGAFGGWSGATRAAERRWVEPAEESRCEEIHRRLKRIVKARGALDRQEAAVLREAEAAFIWRRYGYSSLLEYMEREMGYTPRVAIERLRVAKAIEELPQIGEAMQQGELSFSAARELTRVATADTEGEWLAAGAEINQRQLEELVAGHKRGNRPTDRPDPSLRRKVVRFELKQETYALLRQAQQRLDKERGERLDEDAFIAAVCRMVIDRRAGDETSVQQRKVSSMNDAAACGDGLAEEDAAACGDGLAEEDAAACGDGLAEEDAVVVAVPTKAPYQVAVTVCRDCKRGWQDGGGVTVEMSPPAIERALCDAEEIGSIDGAKPERAKQVIPPAVRRFVWRRDHGRCRVPGCRSSSNLDVHHIVPREHGGTNEPGNLLLLCEGHHLALHEGNVVIPGRRRIW